MPRCSHPRCSNQAKHVVVTDNEGVEAFGRTLDGEFAVCDEHLREEDNVEDNVVDEKNVELERKFESRAERRPHRGRK